MSPGTHLTGNLGREPGMSHRGGLQPSHLLHGAILTTGDIEHLAIRIGMVQRQDEGPGNV